MKMFGVLDLFFSSFSSQSRNPLVSPTASQHIPDLFQRHFQQIVGTGASATISVTTLPMVASGSEQYYSFQAEYFSIGF
jgi:hypothetical protein